VLNVHDVNDVKHTKVHTAEPSAPERLYFEAEIAIEKVKKHKLLGTD